MSERMQPVELNEAGPAAIRAAFANQVAYCRANDAPITARIVAALATLIDKPTTEFARRIAGWEGAPLADALPLRAAGGLHALHLGGIAPDLAPIYADAEDINDAAIVGAVVAHHEAALLPWLDGPPQTNEAGRSSNFIAAMLWLVEQGLPPLFDCLEIGSSAGINLMLDRYHYDLGGVQVGPHPGVMAFTPEWRGRHPPQHGIGFAELKGCDVGPVDLTVEGVPAALKRSIDMKSVRKKFLPWSMCAIGCSYLGHPRRSSSTAIGCRRSVVICGPKRRRCCSSHCSACCSKSCSRW